MRFKDFLAEKAMTVKTYSGVAKRLGTTAKVGFEFEMIIPEDSPLYTADHNDRERDTELVRHYDTFNEFDEYFDIGPQSRKAIKQDFDKWAESDDSPRHAFKDWLESEFRSSYGFIQHYDLQPLYGWFDDSERYASVYIEPESEEGKMVGTAEEMRNALDDVVSEPVMVHSSYHQMKKLPTSWYIEPDGSIEAGDGHGLELVSPPLLLDEAIKTIEKIFAWMKSVGAKTNESTAIHINVSVPDIKEKLDPVKLVLFMGEDYATSLFGRAGNKYSKPQIDVILNKVKTNGKIPRSAEELLQTSWTYLSKNKNHTVNLGQLVNGYLEFRVAGGEGYEQRIVDVKKMVYRLMTAVEIACDPVLERNEYLKKLSNLFSRAGKELQNVTKSDINELPTELHRLYKYSINVKRAWDTYEAASLLGPAREELVSLIHIALYTAHSFNTSIDIKERVFFKKLIKENSLQSHDVDIFYGDDKLDRLHFKKELGL